MHEGLRVRGRVRGGVNKLDVAPVAKTAEWTHRAYGPYALCVKLFNGFRRLVLGAYCVVFGGIPAHNEGILDGSRNCTRCRFIFIQSSHKRRYSAHTATSLPLRVSLPSMRLLAK